MSNTMAKNKSKSLSETESQNSQRLPGKTKSDCDLECDKEEQS